MDPVPDARPWPSAYFALQGTLGATWWVWLALDERFRARFSPPGDPDRILVLALPDVLLFVGGSFAAALWVRRGSRLAVPAAWGVVGASCYALLWCASTWLLEGTSRLGAALMLPATVFGTAAAARLSRDACGR